MSHAELLKSRIQFVLLIVSRLGIVIRLVIVRGFVGVSVMIRVVGLWFVGILLVIEGRGSGGGECRLGCWGVGEVGGDGWRWGSEGWKGLLGESGRMKK